MVATGIAEIECGFNLAERERLDELEEERKRRERELKANSNNHRGKA